MKLPGERELHSVSSFDLSSLSLPGNGGGGAEERGSSTRLPRHKYIPDRQDREWRHESHELEGEVLHVVG